MTKIEIAIKIDGEPVATHGVMVPAEQPVQPWPMVTKESVEWVINELGEIGVSIAGGSPFFCYKGASFRYSDNNVRYRAVGTRELGEVLRIKGHVAGVWLFNPNGVETKLT